MSQAQVQFLSQHFEFCRALTLGYTTHLAPELRLAQLRPNKATPLWLVGHCANTIDRVGVQWSLGAAPVLPATWNTDFGADFAGGKPVTTVPANYPAWDAVVSAYECAISGLIDAMHGLTDADLAGDYRGEMPERLRERFGKLGVGAGLGVALQFLAQHDAYHRGQLGLIASYSKNPG